MHVNHHATSTSTNPTWINTLKPTVAVSSCSDKSVGVWKDAYTKLKKIKTVVYTTGDATKYIKDTFYDDMIRLSDDVVITVSTNGKEFIVTNSRGEMEAHYQIKQNKKEPVKCYLLEDEN